MPIYAYKCATCGHAKDVLQKISDPHLTTCPSCGAETFVKQVTAAGFRLKGDGWYVTDFRDGDKSGDKAKADKSSDKSEAASTGSGDAGGGKTESATKSEPASTSPPSSKPASGEGAPA